MYQNLFFRAGTGRSRAFIGGAGAEKKVSGAGAEEKWLGSATLPTTTNNSEETSIQIKRVQKTFTYKKQSQFSCL